MLQGTRNGFSCDGEWYGANEDARLLHVSGGTRNGFSKKLSSQQRGCGKQNLKRCNFELSKKTKARKEHQNRNAHQVLNQPYQTQKQNNKMKQEPKSSQCRKCINPQAAFLEEKN
jgi:hypothetical protein